ncbi:MAG: RHS repeat-associated core domain-containing protein [Fimbriimonadaceae bacterium]|nr:RHS repeat-associated core domain-containing protein [Fimbriimonadaceae bacterium]
MIATLTKGSGGTYQVSARRYTDPWGVTRVGASSGSPDQRYCASLGHRQDDERCLTYMRARYYEPTTGRFISEDPARDGGNWFAYCHASPTTGSDSQGRFYEVATLFALGSFFAMGAVMVATGGAFYNRSLPGSADVVSARFAKAAALFAVAVSFYATALSGGLGGEHLPRSILHYIGTSGAIANLVFTFAAGMEGLAKLKIGTSLAMLIAVTCHTAALIAELVNIEMGP